MTFDVLGDLNWLAVIVAAIAYFAIGAIWYAPPVLGKTWMAAGGISPEQTQSQDGPGAAIYVVPLIGSVLSAIALGMLAEATGTDTLGEGLVLGVVVAIGFALAIALVTGDVRNDQAQADGLGCRERRVPHRRDPGRRRDHRSLAVKRGRAVRPRFEWVSGRP